MLTGAEDPVHAAGAAQSSGHQQFGQSMYRSNHEPAINQLTLIDSDSMRQVVYKIHRM